MKRVGLFLLIIISIASCKEEKTPPVLLEDLTGKWMIEEATRNNRKTNLLRNGYIEISDSTFRTNLFKDETPYSYSYTGKEIKVMDERKSAFNVKSITSDTLIVWTRYQKFEFKLKTVKNSIKE